MLLIRNYVFFGRMLILQIHTVFGTFAPVLLNFMQTAPVLLNFMQTLYHLL